MSNTAIHTNLLALGYKYTHYEEDYYETGDAETGPKLDGHPAFDEYESTEDYIIIDDSGCFAHYEKRDHAFEAYCNQMMEAINS